MAADQGTGEIVSWVIFHRKYFDDFPPPYNMIAVRLDEGPIVISNLVGPEPDGHGSGGGSRSSIRSTRTTVPKMKLA